MNDDKFKYQYSGLKWLYEMELLDDPQLINNLKLNIFAVSDSIKEVEFVMSQEDRKMLIWIQLSWWGQKFKAKTILNDAYDILRQLLPNYKFRIVTDRSILDLAITKLNKSIRGGTYALSSDYRKLNAANNSERKDELPEASNILPDQKEPAKDEQQKSDESVESNLQGVEEEQDPS